MLMIACRPVASSWQKATCSYPSGDRGGGGGDRGAGDVEPAGDDVATVVTPCVRNWSARFAHIQPMPSEKQAGGPQDEPVRTGVTSHIGHPDMALARRSLCLAHAPKWTYQIRAASEDP